MLSNPQHLSLTMFTANRLTEQQWGLPWDLLQPTCFQYITKVNGLRINRRYVDDIFVMFEKKDHVKKFLRYINFRHRNIKFTYEEKKENKISFSDISISRNNNTLETSISRKPTGVYTNFNRFLPTEHKIKQVCYTRCYTEHITFIPAIRRFMIKLII